MIYLYSYLDVRVEMSNVLSVKEQNQVRAGVHVMTCDYAVYKAESN